MVDSQCVKLLEVFPMYSLWQSLQAIEKITASDFNLFCFVLSIIVLEILETNSFQIIVVIEFSR